MKKIAIIGGGAAGLMAANIASQNTQNYEVLLFEGNPILGRKVIISGGGRCNVTTGFSDMDQILEKYPRGKEFLKHAFSKLTPKDLYKWIEKRGVPLKTEADMRVFPKSNNGKDIVKLFEKLLKASNSQILLKTKVTNITKVENKFEIETNTDSKFTVDKVILTTGGQAYRHTGSKGDGYQFAINLGHSITQLGPSLNAFIVKEDWLKKLSGLSFKDIKLTFVKENRYSFQGPALFTHKGITGPAVFALSSLSAYEKFTKEEPAKLFIDFFPETKEKSLLKKLKEKIGTNPRKTFRKTLNQLIPQSLSDTFCNLSEINPEKRNAETGKKQLSSITNLLKRCPITLIGRSAGTEFVTAGGVKLEEVDPKTMESKICKNLYFAGEILNFDGFTGGFNLHAAWSTGKLAGGNSTKD